VLSSEELLEKDAQHVIRAWASIAEPMPVVEGKGALLKDPEGREHIDCSSGLYRAILESYGYGIRHGLEEMATRGQDNQLKRVVATGGGARSLLWRQIVSDIVGIIQEYVSRADAPLADAYLAGYGVGLFPDFETMRQEWLEVTSITQPRMDMHLQYQPLYEVYRDLHQALSDQFTALDRALGGIST
jgi:sugar (pentulose or hexulose) kinase